MNLNKSVFVFFLLLETLLNINQHTMFKTQIIGERKAKEIVSYVLKLAGEKNVKLPHLTAFLKEGAKAGILLEAYEEFNNAVNNGNNPNSVRISYDDSLRFRNFVLSFIPTKKQIEMIRHYGVAKIFTFNG
jgi:hypothetical protein